MGGQLDAAARRLRLLLLQHHPDARRAAPTRQGFWAAILKGIRGYGELASNRKAAQITREDVMAGGSAMISVFIREPEFVGQTKDRLATQEAARLVETAVRDRFDHWLAADTRTAGAILDYLVLKAEERAAAAGREGDAAARPR